MNKELEAFVRLEQNSKRYKGRKQDLDIVFATLKKIENADNCVFTSKDDVREILNDNHFYHHIIDKICKFLSIDISSHRDLIETENEILNTILENENKLKALEIIKEKPIVALVDYKYTYEEWLELVDEKDKDLFKNKEEYDLLKEVLL